MVELKPFFRKPENIMGRDRNYEGKHLDSAWECDFHIHGKKIALLGVPDARGVNGIEKICHESPGKIRNQLLQLISNHSNMVIDLGDLVEGKTFRDTFFALGQVVHALIEKNVVPVIIGCSDAFIYSIYNALSISNIKARHVHIDYRYDDLSEEYDIVTNDNYFGRIKEKFYNQISEISLLGYQTYYGSSESFSMSGDIPHTNYRLGWIRSNLLDTEPIFRNAEITTLDLNSVRISDNPANSLGMPNGLYAEEICQLAWYAGYSDKLSIFGVFNYISHFDNRDSGARLVAQIIWHFIEGFAQRQTEIPNENSEKFVQLHVNLESIGQKLVFIKSNKTGRFWLKINKSGTVPKEIMLPVSKQEYFNAVNNQVSDKMLFYLTQM